MLCQAKPSRAVPAVPPRVAAPCLKPGRCGCPRPCRATFDPDTIRSRLRELAFLNSRATIFFRAVDGKQPAASANGSSSGGGGEAAAADAAAAATLSPAAAEAAAAGWEVFHYSGGLAEYVRYLNRDKEAIHEPFFFSKQARSLHAPPHARPALCGLARAPRTLGTSEARPTLASIDACTKAGSAGTPGLVPARWLTLLAACPPTSRSMATQWRWRCSGAAMPSGRLASATFPLSNSQQARACPPLPPSSSGGSASGSAAVEQLLRRWLRWPLQLLAAGCAPVPSRSTPLPASARVSQQ